MMPYVFLSMSTSKSENGFKEQPSYITEGKSEHNGVFLNSFQCENIKSKRKISKCCYVCILSIILNIILMIAVFTTGLALLKSKSDVDRQKIKQPSEDFILVPCERNPTNGQSFKDIQYCHKTSDQAVRNLLTLFTAEYIGRRNLSEEQLYKDENRPVLRQKLGELYYLWRNNASEVTLMTSKHTRGESLRNNKTSLTVQSDGSYIIYVSLQYCFRIINQTSDTGVVSLKIVRHAGNKNDVLIQNDVHYRSGLLSFIPENILFPVILAKGDQLSLHVTNIPNLYAMKISNVFGLQEIRQY